MYTRGYILINDYDNDDDEDDDYDDRNGLIRNIMYIHILFSL